MAKFLTATGSLVASFVFVLWGVAVPLSVKVKADELPPEQATTTTESSSQPTQTETVPMPSTEGPTSPTGAESRTYTYNPETSLWENDYYTWDPVTKQTKPKTPQSYSYNPETGRWDTVEWVYDSPSGKYVPNTISSPTEPNGEEVTTPDSLSTENTAEPTAVGKDSTTKSSSNSNGIYDLFFDASISTTVNSTATSGNVSVLLNTSAGDALSGEASSIVNVINLLQSSWVPPGGNMTTFISSIDGDVFGDIMVDPGAITNEPLSVTDGTPDNVDINIAANGLIENDINLTATSGDVTASRNTSVGNATSGSALAVANVVNLMNSLIATNQSFMGVITIKGNFNGDVLMPEYLLQNLIASNASANSEGTNHAVDTETHQTINNNVSAVATSGDVVLASNTSAGDATSGDAETKVTILNLTGRTVIGKNALLVFVNVLGNWVGLIMNAPAGATAAAIGNADSPSYQGDIPENINAETNSVINNNISATATSGDVNVAHNTRAGDGTSGNAMANVNLLNIVNSQLSLSDWFGVLFINVLGNWYGSFGVDTDAGEPPIVPSVTEVKGTSNMGRQSVAQVFRFMPAANHGYSRAEDKSESTPAVASTEDNNTPVSPAAITAATTSIPVKSGINILLFAITTTIAGVLLLGGRRMLGVVRARL